MASDSNITPTILLLGTCDTKLPEILYTKSAIKKQGPQSKVLIMDIGRNPSSSSEVDIKQSDILNTPPQDNPALAKSEASSNISTLDRDTYIKILAPLAAAKISNLYKSGQINAVLSIGGSCGTALATTAMRDGLPIGVPKLMVSTMASGDVGPYIGEADITMMYSVVDIAGRNQVLDIVLRNAAGAIFGMACVYCGNLEQEEKNSDRQKGQGDTAGTSHRIGISMFGVTTPAVTVAREHLESILPGCEVYVFHATGSGGRAMERLISEGQIDAVLDLTTTEIADEVVGGVLSAGPNRLVAATKRDLPRVVSVGACDMVNFGTFDSIPERFANGTGSGKDRVFHRHNPTVTIMRTTVEESEQIARVIAKNIRGTSQTTVLLPTGGVSMVDVPGQPFWDPDTDEVLFSTLEEELCDSGISIVKDERDVNNPEFAKLAAEMLKGLIEKRS